MRSLYTGGRLVFNPRALGRLYASDAQSGKTAWRFEATAPLLSGVTPTAGGIVFFGDTTRMRTTPQAARSFGHIGHTISGAPRAAA
jgi:alcohol dehydrogenase (cytochrome c)